MTKLIVAFRNFATEHKKFHIFLTSENDGRNRVRKVSLLHTDQGILHTVEQTKIQTSAGDRFQDIQLAGVATVVPTELLSIIY
jgi:hypothetical protein